MKTRLIFFLSLFILAQASLFAQEQKAKPFKNDKGTLMVDAQGTIKVKSGNEDTKIGMNRNISITENSGTNFIPFSISKESLLLQAYLNAKVQKGSLKITLLDPQGNKRGHMTINASITGNTDNSWNEQVEGIIEKQFVQPLSGDWKFKVEATKATAQINMKVMEN